MNKFLKLPLFLGVVGGICTAVLATTYAITNPIKVAKENEAKNKAFEAILVDFGLTTSTAKITDYVLEPGDSEQQLPSELSSKGLTRKVIINNTSDVLVGGFYEGTVTGYGGDIKFQLSFKEAKCHSFVCLSNSETPGFGADLLAKIPSLIEGKDVTYLTQSALDTDFGSGCTVTETYLVPAIAAAASDYAVVAKL